MAYRRFRRIYARGRGRFRRYRRTGGFRGINVKFIGGMAAGVLAPTVFPYQDTIMTALAVLPIRVPGGLKGIAQGYVMGRIAKPFLGGIVPSFGVSQANQDFA